VEDGTVRYRANGITLGSARMLHTAPITPAPDSGSSFINLLRRWLPFAQNLLVIAVLYEIYELSRGLIPRNGQIAVQHADAVWNWEVRHGLFVEPAWQQFWLTREHALGWLHLTPNRVADFLNTGYLYVHFVGTIVFLVWLFFRRRQLFPLVRNIFFVTTALALAIYILYPLAPPRLTPNLLYYNHHYTFIDTIQQVINPKYQTSEIGYNPYAAMPSLHFGWALIIGCTLALTLRAWPLRLLGLCYPFFMLAVIVISGNHYFADALGSAAVVSVATLAAVLWMKLRTQLPWYRTAPAR
jgi:membrane-associated phospholipid phosphatase